MFVNKYFTTVAVKLSLLLLSVFVRMVLEIYFRVIGKTTTANKIFERFRFCGARILYCVLPQTRKISCQKEIRPLFANFRFAVKTPDLPLIRNKYDINSPVLLSLSWILSLLGFEEKMPEDKENQMEFTIKRGIYLIQKEEYKKAEKMLHIALKMAQDLMSFDGVTYIYDVLANLAFETGEFAKSEKLFINVIQRVLSQGIEPHDDKIINMSLKLAKIYEFTNRNKKAEQGYQYCIEHMEKKVLSKEQSQDTIALCGMSQDWYARFLLNQGRIKEAFHYFKKAYNICVEVNGMDHEQTAVLLNDLGTVSNLLGDTENALNYIQEAVKIGQKLPEMKDLGAIYVNLGRLYTVKKMYEESKSACQEGLTSAKKNDEEGAMKEAQHCLEELDKLFM